MRADDPQNWIELFNGHNLEGWRPSENKGSGPFAMAYSPRMDRGRTCSMLVRFETPTSATSISMLN